MSNSVQTAKLKDLCSKIGSGATPKGGKESYIDHGIPLIRSQNVLMNEFSVEGLAFLNASQADELKNVIVQPDDVLLNITGDSVARVCQAPISVCPARVNQHVAIIRPNPEKLNPTFLRYYLASPKMQDYLHGLASSGATRQALTKMMLEEFDIPLPRKDIQDRIAYILNSLDQKIELNRKINDSLESMSKSIFKEWFIDFGPVKAKAEGKKPFGMDDETASHFPVSFEDSDIGQIPKGWRVSRIADMVDVSRGSSPRPIQDYIGDDVPWFKIADATASKSPYIFSTKERIKKEGEQYSVVVNPGDFIVSNSATCGVPKFVQLRGCVHDGWLVFKNFKVPQLFLYHSFVFIAERLNQIADGSVQKNLNTSIVGNERIILPTEKLIEKFTELVSKQFDLILSGEIEINALTELRDLLLPKLISGELELTESK